MILPELSAFSIRHSSPLHSTEIFDGVPVITDRHVAEANIDQGLSGGEALKVASLSSGARGLLVAMVCHSKPEPPLVTKTGGPSMDFGPIPMNMSEILQSFTRMLEAKKNSGGIQIGHEPTIDNVGHWIFELHSCSLINGGANRSCRSDKV